MRSSSTTPSIWPRSPRCRSSAVSIPMATAPCRRESSRRTARQPATTSGRDCASGSTERPLPCPCTRRSSPCRWGRPGCRRCGSGACSGSRSFQPPTTSRSKIATTRTVSGGERSRPSETAPRSCDPTSRPRARAIDSGRTRRASLRPTFDPPRVAFRPGGAPLDAQRGVATQEPASGGLLAGFAARSDLSPGLIALMIAVAVGVGAVHSLGPGHGKSLIGAYLIGAGGTLRQAIAVGAAVSVMHTASVLGLGLLVLSAERIFAPDRVYPWLGLASGLVALGLGAALLVSRIHALSERRRHGHDHPHPRATALPTRTGRARVRRRDPAVAERARRPPRLGVDRPDRPRSRPDRGVQHRVGGVARRRRGARDPCASHRHGQAPGTTDATRARRVGRLHRPRSASS